MKMKSFFILVTTLLSLASYGVDYGELCSTHGECQELYPVENGQKCFKVKTGTTANGEITCSIRCYYLPVGSYCKKFSGSEVGKCVKEKFDIPVIDYNDPHACNDAIDPLR